MSLGGDAVTADFFAMFDVPFRFGGGWSANDDARHATVAVISRGLNDKLFGGRDSVGQEIRLDGHVFRIAGVLDDWNPKPRFFDAAAYGVLEAFDDTGDIYIPFTRAIDMKKSSKHAGDRCRTESAASAWRWTPHGSERRRAYLAAGA